jgi:hypothetical protein
MAQELRLASSVARVFHQETDQDFSYVTISKVDTLKILLNADILSNFGKTVRLHFIHIHQSRLPLSIGTWWILLFSS